MEKNLLDFKMSFESPRLYLDNFIGDTRNKVDIGAELQIIKCNNDFSVNDKINNARQIMIERINLFEKECLANFCAHKNFINQICQEISNQISFSKDERLLEELFFEFKKDLFANKVLHFLLNNNNNTTSARESQDYFGKLIHIDGLLSDKCLEFVFR